MTGNDVLKDIMAKNPNEVITVGKLENGTIIISNNCSIENLIILSYFVNEYIRQTIEVSPMGLKLDYPPSNFKN
jgi:hypothetical protein